MVDSTTAPSAVPETNPQQPSLLDASLRLASVMRYGDLTFSATADRIEDQHPQPGPMVMAPWSAHVVAFLRALDRARQAREDGRPLLEAEATGPRPSYGPRLREIG